MIRTTWQSQTVRLITEVPDGPVSGRFTLPTEKVRGLTGREGRRALGASLRVDLRWEATLTGAQISALRGELQTDGADTDLPFITPFWPGMVRAAEVADTPLGSAGCWVAWRADGSHWVLAADAAGVLAVLAEVDYAAPGLTGRLDVESEAVEPAVTRVRLNFREDGGSALAPVAETWALGPALPDGSQPKVSRWSADWRRNPGTGSAEVEVERRQIGAARAVASAYHPQIAERIVQAQASLVGLGQVATLLRWWQEVRGDVEAHYATTLLTDAHLEIPAAAGATTLQLLDAEVLGANRLLVLEDGVGGQEWVRIQSISGDVCTLTTPLSRAWAAATTQISLSMLARHATAELEVDFHTPGYATAALAWREVPAELQPAAGETRGTTLGAEATLAWLYELSVERVGGTPEVTRLTGYERDLTASGQTWTTWPVEHGEIRQSLRLERDELQIRMRYREPLSLYLPGRHDAVLRVAVRRCVVSGGAGSSVEQVCGGEVTGSESDGPFVTLSCGGINRLFGRPAPRYLMQTGCNYGLFESRCGLSRTGWSVGAVVAALSGATVTIGTLVPGGAVPVGWGGAHWFAGGYLERAGGRRALILDSAALGSGQVVLTLVAVVVPALMVGEAVTVVPGCDGLHATCVEKFDNGVNFGGFPFVPDRSPQFQPLNQSGSRAGKK